ncbi:hypothetical protein ACHAXA_007086 [Cyclostephanos tholiformis]|uniref:RRM domain-containing protein n=1 Tax=Cyclostephanos tholiformis TaxID=382380 RepID=A0ABD3RZ97_9STRA
MSLLNSIFGGTTQRTADASSSNNENHGIDDLFGSKVVVAAPLVVRKDRSASAREEADVEEGTGGRGGRGGGGRDDDESPVDIADEDNHGGDRDDVGPTSPDGGDVAYSSRTIHSPDDETTIDEKTTTKRLAAEALSRSKAEEEDEKSRTIFVGNLPPHITRRALTNIFKKCGKISSTRLRSLAVMGVKLPPEQAGNQNMMRKVCANTGKVSIDGTSKRSAQGYVVFESIESVDVALSMNNMSYENHTLRVDGADPTVDPSRSVFVGNLPYGADEETLREHFGRILTNGEDLNEGEGCAISGVRIVRDGDTQKCKGFGYVTLRDGTLISSAMRAHGTTYMKRELRVMICGKRFKGKRGGETKKSWTALQDRAHKGDVVSRGEQSSKKRKISVDDSIADGGATRRRRARSEKRTVYNSGTKPSGLSKRAASAQKANKRVKKLQNRVVKGMGKKKL